jgi:hypothetical protein
MVGQEGSEEKPAMEELAVMVELGPMEATALHAAAKSEKEEAPAPAAAAAMVAMAATAVQGEPEVMEGRLPSRFHSIAQERPRGTGEATEAWVVAAVQGI